MLSFAAAIEAEERLVSLSPSVTEIVYALKAQERLVATSEYSLYPPQARNLPTVGGYSNPNLEKIVYYKPSLVIGHDFNQKTLDELSGLGIKTLSLRLRTLDDIKYSIKRLSLVLGVSGDATVKLIDDAVKNAPKSQQAQKVMIVYGLYEDLRGGIYIAGNDIFFNDIISICGNTNAYTHNITGQPVLSYENVIALNPDRIIILHSQASNPSVNKQKALSAWHKLPTNASKNKKITVVDESYINIPSHRVYLTIERLCKEMFE